MDPETFRAEAHRVVDWMADYLRDVQAPAVVAAATPWAPRPPAPARARGGGVAVRSSLRRLRAAHRAGDDALGPPAFLRVLLRELQPAVDAAREAQGGAGRPVHVVNHLSSRDRARAGDDGLAGPAARAAGRLHRR